MFYFVLGTTSTPCCAIKTVKNAPCGKAYLNGEYVLQDSFAYKVNDSCADGCVYTKDDEEYCFMNVPPCEASDIACNATTGGQGAAGSTTGSGATSTSTTTSTA